MTQTWLALLIVALAAAFLGWRLFRRRGCASGGCAKGGCGGRRP